MTQHEYVFIAISIILGLAITRLLSSVAGLIRAHTRVTFHWATAVWSACVMLFILQLWWVGWELRSFSDWSILDFFALVIGAIFVYGAAELSLPTEDYDISNDSELDFLDHSHSLGRVSAGSMLGYFCMSPYVNVTIFGYPALPSIAIPLLGGFLMVLVIAKPAWFKVLSVVFANYAIAILYMTS
ncbi:MAG: hypothetical protein AB8B57_05995 [Congregibacter sp.]